MVENIIFCGLITRIAMTLGYNLYGFKEVKGSSKIDLDICLEM